MIRRILVALDGSHRAASVLVEALDIAERFQARLVLLRVVHVPQDFPAAAHVDAADPLPAAMHAEALHQLEELVSKHPRAGTAKLEVRTGQAWRVIVDVASELDVDLVVIGSHGFSGWDHLLGTTAERVVNHASRNVLVVRSAAP